MTTTAREARNKPLHAGLRLSAAVLAATLAGGCSGGQPPAVAARPQATATVLSWGSFFGGRPGSFGTRTSPAAVRLPRKVAEVGTSNAAQYALLADGSLYAWGLGTQGELGDGSTASSFTRPVRVRFPAGVKIASIPTDAMPYDTGLAVDTRGHAWGWGGNGGGELCLGTAAAYLVPVKLPLSQVSALAGASNHALYDAGGTVWACGQNVAGDLGDGSPLSAATPVRVAGLSGQPVVRLVAAFANSGALPASGQYYGWGYNTQRQLGDGHSRHFSDILVLVHLPAAVTQVAQDGSLWNNGQTLVLLADGSLWAWATTGPASSATARGECSPRRSASTRPPGSPTAAWRPGQPPPTRSPPAGRSTRGASVTWARWATGAPAPPSRRYWLRPALPQSPPPRTTPLSTSPGGERPGWRQLLRAAAEG